MGRKRKKKSGFFSRRDLAEHLKVRYSRIESWQDKGIIVGDHRDDEGTWWFQPSELSKARRYMVARKNPDAGDLTAAVFEHVKRGVDFRESIIELRITGPRYAEIREQYDPGMLFVRPKILGRIKGALEARGLAFESDEQLAAHVERLAQRDERLAGFELSRALHPAPKKAV